MHRVFRRFGLAVLLLAPVAFVAQDAPTVLDAKLYHLGDNDVERWGESSTVKPHGKEVAVAFRLAAAPGESTLELHQVHIDDERWSVAVNGKVVGTLRRNKEALTIHLPVPAGILKRGANRLTVSNPRGWKDDVLVGKFRLHLRPFRDVMGLGTMVLSVKDSTTGKPIPTRITLQDGKGGMAKLYGGRSEHTAVRDGVIYTLGGETAVDVAPGEYVVHATRGTEWGLARGRVTVDRQGRHALNLEISREVETPGFVAADTHIHTLTHSGHGDSSVEERMVTLAGEGVELAIATDHNHNTDYRPTQNKLGVGAYFTPVVGNEVSTDLGHINAFPLVPGDPVPDKNLKSWVALASEIRSKGARVTTLNHPRWRQDKKTGDPAGPFREQKLNRVTGRFGSGTRFPFDGMEVINSETLNSKRENLPLYVLEDWLALLNAGETVKAVGSSDSHTVGDPVGQGRTYVASRAKDPSKINVQEACEAFVEGRTTISLGIVTDIRVAGRYGLADLVRVERGERIPVRVRVAAPSWVRPRQVMLYVNGVRAEEQTVNVAAGTPTDQWVEFSLAGPAVDAHLVAVVLGDPVKEAYWKTDWDSTLAATNPVYLDADGDGKYRSPREQAASRMKALGKDPAKFAAALATIDVVVGVQLADLARGHLEKEGVGRVRKALEKRAAKEPLYHALLETGYE